MLDLFITYTHPNTYNYVKEVLDSNFLSEGSWNKLFENKLSELINNPYVFTVNSGTSALHLALKIAGIGKGDEVIIPSQTFVATGLAVLYCGANPVFADINIEDGNINISSIKSLISSKTKAIIPVHWAGYPCQMDEIIEIAKQYSLIVIDDAAHAFLAEYKGNKIGTISDFTCFSFQAIKHLTTGDGGAVFVKNQKFYSIGKKLRWFGIDKENDIVGELGERVYNLKEIGYKYHMNNIAAAIGLANVIDIQERINKRRELAEIYFKKLDKVNGVKLLNYQSDCKSSYWLFPLLVEKRSDFIKMMRANKINVSVVHQGIHKNKIFDNFKKQIQNQIYFDEYQIHIPIHEKLSLEDIEYIIQIIKRGW